MASSVDSDGDGDHEDYEDDASLAEFLESEVLGDEDADDVDISAAAGLDGGGGGGCCSIGDDGLTAGQTWLPQFVHQLTSLPAPRAGACAVSRPGSVNLHKCLPLPAGAASDEGLWRKLYCLRWGAPPGADRRKKEPRGSAWKKLYFERDQADMVEFVRNTPAEFRELFIQMQAAKRSQAPLPSQVYDDLVVVDTSIADQITAWRRNQCLADVYMGDHCCSGRTCSYYQIGDVFLCEKTGRAHVCDDTCRETVLDPSNELLVCTVSGRCFDRWLSPAEEDGAEFGQQHADANAAAEEGEPFLGSGRLGRAYLLGYNCADERELDEALREVVYPGRKKPKSCHSSCFT